MGKPEWIAWWSKPVRASAAGSPGACAVFEFNEGDSMTDSTEARFSPPGAPSDEAAAILETGRSDINVIFTSMSARDPDGKDAEYLRWHTLDHRPEQFRLAGIRSSIRAVSTPECRAARAVSDPSLDATDHLMTYFFTDMGALQGFTDLAVALSQAGRMSYLLPSVQRAVYLTQERIAAARIKLGADVLPWWPAPGLYLLIEVGAAPSDGLTDIPGVAGLWSAAAADTPVSDAGAEQQITYLFLDDDPVRVGERLRPILRRRWETSGVRPLMAAPFHTLVPHEWERYLP
jgi:hypothetical protein